jgi:hypothetical protein
MLNFNQYIVKPNIVPKINAWRIEDGKGDAIDAWYRAGRFGRFPVWAYQNRFGPEKWRVILRQKISS